MQEQTENENGTTEDKIKNQNVEPKDKENNANDIKQTVSNQKKMASDKSAKTTQSDRFNQKQVQEPEKPTNRDKGIKNEPKKTEIIKQDEMTKKSPESGKVAGKDRWNKNEPQKRDATRQEITKKLQEPEFKKVPLKDKENKNEPQKRDSVKSEETSKKYQEPEKVNMRDRWNKNEPQKREIARQEEMAKKSQGPEKVASRDKLVKNEQNKGMSRQEELAKKAQDDKAKEISRVHFSPPKDQKEVKNNSSSKEPLSKRAADLPKLNIPDTSQKHAKIQEESNKAKPTTINKSIKEKDEVKKTEEPTKAIHKNVKDKEELKKKEEPLKGKEQAQNTKPMNALEEMKMKQKAIVDRAQARLDDEGRLKGEIKPILKNPEQSRFRSQDQPRDSKNRFTEPNVRVCIICHAKIYIKGFHYKMPSKPSSES